MISIAIDSMCVRNYQGKRMNSKRNILSMKFHLFWIKSNPNQMTYSNVMCWAEIVTKIFEYTMNEIRTIDWVAWTFNYFIKRQISVVLEIRFQFRISCSESRITKHSYVYESSDLMLLNHFLVCIQEFKNQIVQSICFVSGDVLKRLRADTHSLRHSC